MSVVNEYGCGIHDLSYRRVEPGCPACELERRLEEVSAERDKAMGDLAEMRGQMRRIQGISDLATSAEHASDLLDDRDRAFLVKTLQRWRDHKDIDLEVTEARRGFIIAGHLHECSSAGGIAIAGFFAEAVLAYGRPVAMSLLLRGMSAHLEPA